MGAPKSTALLIFSAKSVPNDLKATLGLAEFSWERFAVSHSCLGRALSAMYSFHEEAERSSKAKGTVKPVTGLQAGQVLGEATLLGQLLQTSTATLEAKPRERK